MVPVASLAAQLALGLALADVALAGVALVGVKVLMASVGSLELLAQPLVALALAQGQMELVVEVFFSMKDLSIWKCDLEKEGQMTKRAKNDDWMELLRS